MKFPFPAPQSARAEAKKLLKRVKRRLDGPTWHRLGEHVTFRVGGFASAPSRPMFAARTFYEVQYLNRILGAVETKEQVLEVGCGFGRLSPYIAEHFDQHTAVDVNPDALALAANAYPHTTFQLGSGTKLDFDTDRFDCIVTWTVLQHIPPAAIQQALDEIKRVAKASATIVLCEATRYADKNQPEFHTQDRTVDFYKRAFGNRPLTLSTDIAEIDRLEGMSTPGHIMVFGPVAE